MKKTIILLILVLAVIAGLFALVSKYQAKLADRKAEEPGISQPAEQNIAPISKDDLIILNNPLPNQNVTSPLLIEGRARGSWYFEASFPINLYDENNNLIGQAVARAQGDWMTGNYVPFKAEINFNQATSSQGTIVLKKDNPSGLPEYDNELIVPIKFMPILEKTKIKVFFSNSRLDPEISCDRVFSVEREVVKTSAIARAALTELLAGPTASDQDGDFSTSLNPDIKIQSLNIKNGVATVDFDKQLESQIGGSCKVAAIRAQITETLKQFPTVNTVIISIDGRTEDILQP